MAWDIPSIPGAGTIATVTGWATKIISCLRYLKGLDSQVPTIESGLIIDNTDGDEYLKLPLLSTAECTTVLNAEGEVAFDETTHQMKEYDGTAVRVLISEADVDDTPVNGATTVPVSSNWAYDFQQALTTAGDVPYATGAGVWNRLGIGTANQLLRTNAGATAPEWATVAPATIVRKTADETVNNSAVLQNDDHLLLAMGANEVWSVKVMVLVTSPTATTDFKCDWAMPVACSAYGWYWCVLAAGTLSYSCPTDVTADLQLDSPTSATPILLGEYLVVNGANAGNFQFRWAQLNAVAEDTKVLTNSFMVCHKIA